MFYLTSKIHDNRVNTFGFMEGGGAFEAPPPPPHLPGPGTPKKPRRNRVKFLILVLFSFHKCQPDLGFGVYSTTDNEYTEL